MFSGRSALIDAATSPTFAVDAESIPPEVFGLTSYASPIAAAPRVSRKEAMSVPAVKRSRDLICATLGGLPIDLLGPDKQLSRSSLFEQPEQDVPRSVTFTKTFEDMLFERVAWWRVLDFGWHTYPTRVKRIDPRKVTVDEDTGRVYINGRHVPSNELIRFDSPTDALLIAGARAIRTCLQLDASASRMSDGTPPVDYFTPADGALDPAEDDEVEQILTDWQDARRKRSTAYVPAALKYNTTGWSPEQLQLSEAREHAVLEIARMCGVDPEELGVSTTSRVYANLYDRRKNFIDYTLGQFRQAFEDRLSMNDVTPRGYVARLNLDAFLRGDTKARYEAYEVGLRVGALTKPEIRALEDREPIKNESEAAPAAARRTELAFDDEGPAIRLAATQVGAAFEVDVEKRTIRGLLVPYGVKARSGGQWWQFSKGSLKWSAIDRVKLWIQHDPTRAVGVAFELDDRDDGLYGALKVARGPEGDRALTMAEDGVWDGFSIGIAPGGKFRTRAGVNHAIEAPLMEVSLTPAPSFDDARVHAVAASAADQGDKMKCNKCGKQHANGVTECNAADVAAFEAEQEQHEEQESGPDFSALGSAISDAIAQGFQNVPPREEVGAGHKFEVDEAAPYRFDGAKGEHEFSTDLINGLKFGDGDAMQRVQTFITEAFAPSFDVDKADTATLNPSRQRPDMYVDRLDYVLPFYNALYKGAINDGTPFVFPKFASASGLSADHVEGVEPTGGSFTATNQTVTPTPTSGKVEITREVWDQGGNPQVSALIWNEMKRAYFEALEAKAVAVLDAATPIGITLPTAAEDDVLVGALENELALLQFIRGGNRFDFLGAHVDLYRRLAAAVDSTGRKLLPILGATNASGTAASKFKSLDVAGVTATPAWGLGPSGAVAESSYLVASPDVHVWNSAPQRLEFQTRVSHVDLAIWGYSAAAISRLDGVREVIYDPTA